MAKFKPKLLSVGTRVLVLWVNPQKMRTTVSGLAVIKSVAKGALFPYTVWFEHRPRELGICAADEVVPVPKNATKRQIAMLRSILTSG